MSKSENQKTENKKVEKNFYAEIKYDFAVTDRPIQAILRNSKLGGMGGMAWFSLNLDLCRAQGFMDQAAILDSLKSWALSYLQPDEVKPFVSELISYAITRTFLWESPVNNLYTTEFALEQTATLFIRKETGRLSGLKKGKDPAAQAEYQAQIDALSPEYYIEKHRKKSTNVKLEDWEVNAFNGLSLESSKTVITSSSTINVEPNSFEQNNLDAENSFKDYLSTMVQSGASAMDVINQVISKEKPQEVTEPVNVLPEDYSLFDEDTPSEISFDDIELDEPEPESKPVQFTAWQAPSIPESVQEDIAKYSPQNDLEDNQEDDSVKTLKSWGIYQNQIDRLVNKTTPEALKAYIKMAEKEGRNKGAYITTAIDNNWDCSRYMEHDSSSESKQPVQKEVVNDVPKTTYVDPNPNPNAYQVGDNDFADKTEVNEFVSMMTGFGFNDAEIKSIVDSNTYDVARDYAYLVFTTFPEPEDKKGFYTDCITKKLEVKHWDRRPIQYKDDVVSSSGARPTDEDTIYRQKWDMAVDSVVTQFIFSDELKNRWKSAWVAFRQVKTAVGASRWAEMVLHLIVSKSTDLKNYFGSQPKALESNIDFLFTRPDLAEGIYNQLDEI